MDGDPDFIRWFTPWKTARPDLTPVGWYVTADLEAAFTAGMSAGVEAAAVELQALLDHQQGKD